MPVGVGLGAGFCADSGPGEDLVLDSSELLSAGAVRHLSGMGLQTPHSSDWVSSATPDLIFGLALKAS
jgi:hypothetical protein